MFRLHIYGCWVHEFPAVYLRVFSKRPTNSSHLFPAAGNNIEDAGREAGQLREGGQGKG
jgi:hypothetical protein